MNLIASRIVSSRKIGFRGVLLLMLLVQSFGSTTSMATGKKLPIEYNRDVRPILSENCFSCHGPDSAARKGGLRLDHFENATNKLEDGTVAILPGKPDKSELVRRVFANDDDQMPPVKLHKELKAEQKEVLKRWILDGAVYQPHWSFIAPVESPLPKVRDQRWVKTPIDYFILHRLEQEKLKPNAEADKRTLVRRVSLDLTGLPPTPEEAEAFVQDKRPDAYEKLVDRLLSSPRWGEHRARYWLDAARYGDTHGIHFDNYREMWTYREWVINAFNRNMPFDEFTIENLAGDLLPNATRDQKIGSGFNRCNITSNEGGAIDEEYLVLYARDRTEATAQTWLGLTAGCAVCHDHKYDPLTQKDFYSLSAYFNNINMKAMDGNVKDTPPVIIIPKPEDEVRWQKLADEIPAMEQKITLRKESAGPEFTNWLAKPDFGDLSAKLGKLKPVFSAPLDEGAGAEINYVSGGIGQRMAIGANTNWQDGAVAAKAYSISGKDAPSFTEVGDFERTNAFSYAAWVHLGTNRNGALYARMAEKDNHFRGWDLWLAEGRPSMHLIHEWPDNAIKVTSKKAFGTNGWQHVCVTYDGSSKAKGVKIYLDGELMESDQNNNNLKDSIRTSVPFKLGQREVASQVVGAEIQDVRLFDRALSQEEVAVMRNLPRLQWLTQKPEAQRTNEDFKEMFGMWLSDLDATNHQLTVAHHGLKAEEKGIRERGTVGYVMNERTNAPEAYLLFRGEYDKRKDRVTPNTPSFLPPLPEGLTNNRLAFAKWLLEPENPLTARVTVNRFWQELFGVGLVKTAGDFGIAGEQPSNQALIDWLAVDFREHDWDVKRFFKQLVMSATYRQSAVTTPLKIEKDPENRLLSRGPRFRMDAEMVRDYALASSGLLKEKIGGPSVRPYQPPGIWEVVGMPGGTTRFYQQDHGDDLYRRSVYTFWKRQGPPASMEIFNAPSRETCTVRRERTDTPLQALVTLNDPQFVEAAKNLAQESLRNKIDAFDFMARRLLARPLTAAERRIVMASAQHLTAHYQASPKEANELLATGETKPDPALDASTLAAYTMVANELMNLDEVLNK